VTGRIRVVVSEPSSGPGVAGLARALRDAGMEVIYTGPGQTPEQIVHTALQEDADVVGLAAGAAAAELVDVVGLLARRDAEDVLVFAAAPDGSDGSGPDGSGPDFAGTRGATVFAPGTSLAEIVEWVRDRSGSP
jgi:methylmalonyl-CoA mutase C-terminal domain/subunit